MCIYLPCHFQKSLYAADRVHTPQGISGASLATVWAHLVHEVGQRSKKKAGREKWVF
jgi:hypothetical protein